MAQVAQRDIWPLRQEERVPRKLHAALAERPDPGEHAEQGGLAGAGPAGDHHGMARLQHQIGMLQQFRAVRQARS